MKFQYKKAPALNEYTTTAGADHSDLARKTIAKDIPCQNACPALTNVPKYIEAIFEKDTQTAFEINQECNVFSGGLGRICTRPCEDACRHEWTNTQGPVTICHLKRFASDNLKSQAKPLEPLFDKSGKRTAVIGGGPAGLALARELKRFGHEVDLFEKNDHLGGMMMDGIPRFRLPADVVQQDIALITASGINVFLNQPVVGRDIKKLLKNYDAVCVATGTTLPNKSEIGEISEEHLTDGLKFMRDYNDGTITKLNGDVIIVGGGFTAIDCARACARAARRLLGEEGNISIFYRRSEQFLAADLKEREEMIRENINIRTLVTPISATSKEGQVTSATFRRNRLVKQGAEGKPTIVPLEDSDFTVPCSHLVMAIGQSQDWSILPPKTKLKKNHATSVKGLFVAGDFESGSKDVIHAVGSAKIASKAIDTFLMGRDRFETFVQVETCDNDGYTGRVRDHDMIIPSQMPLLPMAQRAYENREVETGLQSEDGFLNAGRCYLCHHKFEIDNDKCIHCEWCIDVAPRECIKKVSRVFQDGDGVVTDVVEANLAHEATYIWIDSDQCVRCGQCLRMCPTEAISMKKVELITCPQKSPG